MGPPKGPSRTYTKERNIETGEERWVDQWGYPLKEIPPELVELDKMRELRPSPAKFLPLLEHIKLIPSAAQMKGTAPTGTELLHGFVEELPQTGGAVGGLLGLPIGAPIAGAMAGRGSMRIAKDALQGNYPNVFGQGNTEVEDPEHLGQTAVNTIGEMGGELVGGLLAKFPHLFFPSTYERAKQAAVRRFFKADPAINPTDLNTPFQSVHPIDLVPAQVSHRAKWAGETFASSKLGGIIANQQRRVADTIRRWAYPTELVTDVAQSEAQRLLHGVSAQVDVLGSRFRPHLTGNARNVPTMVMDPTTNRLMPRNTRIEGAIEVNQSLPMAQQAAAEVRRLMDPNNVSRANLRRGLGADAGELETELSKITGIQQPYDGSPAVENFERLQDTHDRLTEYIQKVRTQVNDTDPLLRNLTALRESIGSDIDAGVRSWGPQAFRAYNNHRNAIRELALRSNPGLARNLLDAGASETSTLTQVANDALSDPAKMRTFIHNTGDTNRSFSGKIFMNNLIDQSIDSTKGGYDYGKLLDLLEKNHTMADVAMNPNQLQNALAFLRKAQHIQKVGHGAEGAVALTTGRSVISLIERSPALAAALFGGGIGATQMWGPLGAAGYSGLILGGVGATKLFTERVLLNKKYTRLAMQAIDPQGPSTGARVAEESLKAMMRGTEVWLRRHDGNYDKSYLDEKGNVVLPKGRWELPPPIHQRLQNR